MKIPRPRKFVPYVLVIAGLLFFLWVRSDLQSSKFAPTEGFDILGRAVRHIQRDYVDEADPRRTMEGAFQGLMGSLDLMSSYLNRDLMAKAASPRIDQMYDIGLAAYKRPGAFPMVVGVGENSPAEKAGIKIGDAISGVDDQSTLVWSFNELRLVLKDAGPKPVKIRLIHENATAEKTITRAPAYPVSVDWTAEKGSLGVVRFHHLFAGVAAEFKSTILPKIAGRKETLILDLRGCHEGEIDEARALINLFVKNLQAGTIEKKGGGKTAWTCPADAVLPDVPLIIWVDPATMGPAEIVAAALRDLKRAKIIGTNTVGFTAEQKLFPLKMGDGLLLTVGEFVPASGEKIFEKGLTPDLKVEPNKRTRQDYLEKTKGFFPSR